MADCGASWSLSPARALSLDRPRLLAIINVTADSFYEASRAPTCEEALAHASRAAVEGADALDIGAESTRPGARPVSPEDQLSRILPLLRCIRASRPPLSSIPISIDTTSATVARGCLDAGADAVNDQSALRDDPHMLPLIMDRQAGVILMHRPWLPREDSYSDQYRGAQNAPVYADVVKEVKDFLLARARDATAAGVAHAAIVLDPGLGFGKTVEQNCELVRRSAELCASGYPVLGAASRKSFVGRASLGSDSSPAERLPGSLAFSMAQFLGGVRLFRVHDVGVHKAALAAAARVVPAPPVALPGESSHPG